MKEGTDGNYIELVKEANKDCSAEITLLTSLVRIPIEKGVKQDDPFLPSSSLPASR